MRQLRKLLQAAPYKLSVAAHRSAASLRRNWRGGTVIVCCAAAIIAIFVAIPHPAREGAKAPMTGALTLVGENSNGIVELGELDVGSKTIRRFTVCNNGAAPVPFTVSSSCGCGTIRPRTGVIPADRSMDLVVEMAPRDYRVKGIYRLTVTPDAAGIRPLQMFVRYSCPPPISVSPTELMIEGNRRYQGELVRVIGLTDTHGQPIDPAGEVAVTVSHDWLTVTRNSANPAERIIRVDPARAPGEGSGTVSVRHIPSGYTVYVTVHHRAYGALVIVPRHVFLRKDSRSGDYVATILVRSKRKIHPAALGSDSQPIVLQEVSVAADQRDGKLCMYSVVRRGKPPGPRSGQCRVIEDATASTADFSWQIIE